MRGGEILEDRIGGRIESKTTTPRRKGMVHGQAKRRRTHVFCDISPTSHNVPHYHTSTAIGTIEFSLPFSFIMLLPPLLVFKTSRGIIHSLM